MSTEPINRENLVQSQQNQDVPSGDHPNAVTVAAMEETGLPRFESVGALMADLNGHPDDEMDAKVISKARVSVEFADIDLHDKATELLDSLRIGDINADLEADYYDCPLCGATMVASIDYTHKTDCPYEAFGRAINVFSRAVRAALPALPKPSDEEPKAIPSNQTAENSHETR